ncbi:MULTISPECIES: FxLD family lantipeptide [Protofrankia]|nr:MULTISPECIES: FxLD family lantipeptide [Protofrankia]
MDTMDTSEFRLNIQLVDAGPAPATGSDDCTSDKCGSGETGSDACTTNG